MCDKCILQQPYKHIVHVVDKMPCIKTGGAGKFNLNERSVACIMSSTGKRQKRQTCCKEDKQTSLPLSFSNELSHPCALQSNLLGFGTQRHWLLHTTEHRTTDNVLFFCFAFSKGGTRYEYQRYLELRPRVESPNSASEITCKGTCDLSQVTIQRKRRPF